MRLLLCCRGVVTMTQPFMLAYSQLVIKTCHRRGVHAMGGMAAQIPIKTNPEANNAAMEKVSSGGASHMCPIIFFAQLWRQPA